MAQQHSTPFEPSDRPERVAIYCRVSSDEQAEAGTIEIQTEFARRYTELHGMVVHDYYLDDGVSGTLALDKRPGSRRLMDDARAGNFGVVLSIRWTASHGASRSCWMASRISTARASASGA